MKSFLIALQFLTIIPVRVREIRDSDFGRAVIFFPVTGLILGTVLFLLYKLLLLAGFGVFFISSALTAAGAVLTGGLHLDGLSDTFDGIMSGKDTGKMLEIMRDSHSGVMGTVAVISVMLLKTALFMQLMPGQIFRALLLSGLCSRFILGFSIFLFPYARQEGKAKLFKENISLKIFMVLCALTFTITVFTASLSGAIVFLIAGAAAFGFNSLIKKKLGGLTGDTLGALCETSEVLVLFLYAVMENIL